MAFLVAFLFLTISSAEPNDSLQNLPLEVPTIMHALAIDEERGLQFTVCDKDLDLEPEWLLPSTTLPPLTISSAIGKAEIALATYVDDPTPWKLTAVKARHVRDNRWVYIVSFFLRGDELEIPVLFSGRVVPGESYKSLLERDCADEDSPSN